MAPRCRLGPTVPAQFPAFGNSRFNLHLLLKPVAHGRSVLCHLLLFAIHCLVGSATVAVAGPWLEPGDLGLRHDLTLLADAGVLRTPVATWPISWPDVERDLSAAGAQPSPVVYHALQRVLRAARSASQPGFQGVGLELAGAERPARVRDFADPPREQGHVGAGAAWLGDRFAAGISVSAVNTAGDATDDQRVRLDGSYVGVTFGNYMVSAGSLSQWWGPGWDASLILGTNARPMPRIAIERKYSDASTLPVLRWIGPWRAIISMARSDGSGVAVPDARFFAARLSFKPRAWLEIGLSRTAQWCGASRPCDLGTFADLLIGRDNPGDSQTSAAEPGNQMAGYDFRLRSPWMRLPVALYGQFIGEDEAGGLPAKFIEQLGLEAWGGSTSGSWRGRVEYADTVCVEATDDPLRACQAYRSNAYPQGYTYRGRILGHSIDNDGRAWSLGVMWVRPSGAYFGMNARRLELNRDGLPDSQHAMSPLGAAELDQFEVQWTAPRFDGTLTLSLGYDSVSSGSPARGSGLRGYLRFKRGL